MSKIEGYEYCQDCNTFVKQEHYSQTYQQCLDCLQDEIDRDEAKEAEELW